MRKRMIKMMVDAFFFIVFSLPLFPGTEVPG